MDKCEDKYEDAFNFAMKKLKELNKVIKNKKVTKRTLNNLKNAMK